MVEALWGYVMERRHARKCEAQNDFLVSSVQAHFNSRHRAEATFRVVAASETVYQVEDLKGVKFTVDIGEVVDCDCGQSYAYTAPCKHTIPASLIAGKDPLQNVTHYLIPRLIECSISLNRRNLERDEDINPPEFVKQQGAHPQEPSGKDR